MEDLEENIIVRCEQAKMRSRWFFAARSGLLTLAVIILFAALLYLVSFIIFALGQNGISLAPNFGWNGWLLFFEGLPWGLLLLALVLILILAGLLNHYEFVYHRPLIYALASFVFLIVLASFFVAATSFHKQVLAYSARNLPWVGQFYTYELQEPHGIHRGDVITVGSDTIVIADPSGITSTVVVPQGNMPRAFRIGDTIVVFGGRDASGDIEAFGLQQMP